MKKVLFITALFALTGCTKDWECCIDNTTAGHVGELYEGYNGTTTHCIDFRGTNEEKTQFEDDGTRVLEQENGWGDDAYTYTVTQTTTCSPD